jgi:phage-related protein
MSDGQPIIVAKTEQWNMTTTNNIETNYGQAGGVLANSTNIINQNTNLADMLRGLKESIADLREQGAPTDDCDIASDAVTILETAMRQPTAVAARKEAKGALAMLKGLASGFSNFEKISESFSKVLGQVQPCIDQIFKQIT